MPGSHGCDGPGQDVDLSTDSGLVLVIPLYSGDRSLYYSEYLFESHTAYLPDK
jgi:hypothetical protein